MKSRPVNGLFIRSILAIAIPTLPNWSAAPCLAKLSADYPSAAASRPACKTAAQNFTSKSTCDIISATTTANLA